MDISFEKFDRHKDITKQRDLFVECFPENIGTKVISEEHYLWKFHSISKIGSYEYIAKLNEDLLGYYAGIPYPYQVFGKTVKCAMVCDVMTGVKARGKGVFTRLGLFSINEFKKEDFAFSTGYPIRPEVIPGHKKAGWDFPFEIPMYGKFISLNSFLKSKNKTYLKFPAKIALSVFNRFCNWFNYRNRKNLVIERYSQTQLSNIDGLDIFLKNWRNEQKIALIKDREFLEWRLGAPEKEYSIIVLRENSFIIGYAIVREVLKENVPCLGVLDFAFLSDYKKYSSLLFRDIEKNAKELGAELILMMMMKNQAKEFKVIRNGYLKTPYNFSFIINQFDNSINQSDLYHSKNWCLMWIDSDDL